MPSALALLNKIKNVNVSTGFHGIGGMALETGVGAAASYGLGQAYHRYQDKWYGKNVCKLTAIVGKLGAVALHAFGGPQLGTGVLNAAGQAGVDAYFLEMGLKHARKATGKRAVLIPESAALPPGAVEATTVGALPPARDGRGMTFDQIAEIARTGV